jgi:hypothetical protein
MEAMITIFNRREVYLTYSVDKQAKIRKELSQNNIKYYIKTINRMSPSPISRGTRSVGALGQNTDSNYEYIIYVHKKDYDKAKYLIGKL